MPGEAMAVISLVHRLAGADARARARVARLLCIGETEAAAVLRLAGGDSVSMSELQLDLDLSPGGARALAEQLDREALVSHEPEPADPRSVRLRLAPGGERELAAALGPLADRIDAIGTELPAAAYELIATYLAELAEAAEGDVRP
jgi:DNA-binding MarR family transcriptional regulator